MDTNTQAEIVMKIRKLESEIRELNRKINQLTLDISELIRFFPSREGALDPRLSENISGPVSGKKPRCRAINRVMDLTFQCLADEHGPESRHVFSDEHGPESRYVFSGEPFPSIVPAPTVTVPRELLQDRMDLSSVIHEQLRQNIHEHVFPSTMERRQVVCRACVEGVCQRHVIVPAGHCGGCLQLLDQPAPPGCARHEPATLQPDGTFRTSDPKCPIRRPVSESFHKA